MLLCHPYILIGDYKDGILINRVRMSYTYEILELSKSIDQYEGVHHKTPLKNRVKIYFMEHYHHIHLWEYINCALIHIPINGFEWPNTKY